MLYRTPLKNRTGFVLPTPSNADIESGKKEEADQADKTNCTTPLNPDNNQKNGSPSFANRIKDKITVRTCLDFSTSCHHEQQLKKRT